ncbi:glyoxalase [Natronococcus pandeyae]|uniref:Glyoxalase n=1 Tax=Natronococcus pandeyae TaxID=2055836 RepID=A0A8J8TQN9_9EURY|nr:VOC family protein [Natronococcus pandeyae]TYL36727.1 glyoxalase [Natronococcus pandeyae]
MTADGSLPIATTIGRVALRVADLERVSRFYETVIGLDVRERRGDRTILAAGGDPLLVLVEDPEAPPRREDETGLFHTAFLVPSRAALGDALERIEDRWRLEGSADHVVSEALYLSDPEGNGVEVYRDLPSEAWPVADDGTIGIDTKPLDLDDIRNASRGRESSPDATTVGHVHLEVSSLPAAREFYVDALGMGIKQRLGESALFVAAGDYHHHLGLNVWRQRSTPPRGRGLEWFELVVPGGGALAALRERLERREIDTTDAVDGDGFETADPNGIRLRVRGDVPE